MSFPSSPTRPLKSGTTYTGTSKLQEKILTILIYGCLLLGLAGIVAYYPYAIKSGNLFVFVSAIILMIGGIFLAVVRGMRFELRAGLFLAALYLLDILLLHATGFGANTIPILFALLFFAGLFLGWKATLAIMTLWAFSAGLYWIFSPNPIVFLRIATVEEIGQAGQVLTLVTLIACLASVLISHLVLANAYQKGLIKERSIASELENLQNTTEKRLGENTKYFQRRLLQARVAAEISGSITSILDQKQLLQTVVDLMHTRFDMYYIGVFVVDADRKNATLRVGTGEAGEKMVANHHSLSVGGSSMIGWATLNRQARIALDVGDEAVRFNNPYLPLTRSELALPILSKGEILGALSIQSVQPNAFDVDDVAILQGIANSLGAALENAQLYQRTESALQEVRAMTQDFISTAWTTTAEEHGGLFYQYENPSSADAKENNVHDFPITLRDQVIGTLSIENDSSQLTPEEIAFVEAVTQQTAVALENARLLEETQRHAREEQKLNELSEQFSQARTIDEILQSAVLGLGELGSVSEVSIHLVAPELEGQGSNNGHHGSNGNGHNR